MTIRRELAALFALLAMARGWQLLPPRSLTL